ncbi:unnamed protein product, partial [Ascophyllum nodosum]
GFRARWLDVLLERDVEGAHALVSRILRPTPVELAAKLRPEMREHVANMKPLSKASSSR